MMELFNEYKNRGQVLEAVMIGRNAFNKSPSNQEVFLAYFDLLCHLAENLPSLEERHDFVGQASVALAFFSENAELTNDVVTKIYEYQERLTTIQNGIIEAEQIRVETTFAEVESHNNDCLKKIYALKHDLQGTASQEMFDKTLSNIGAVDSEIDKAALTDEQNTAYEELTKSLTDLVSTKMRDMERKNNVAYNKQAIDSFALAFARFSGDEGKYKNQNQLFSLVSTSLFAYDASRLFNETLIYYNHIYSYIFSKLDDDGKLALTRFSIECERKLR